MAQCVMRFLRLLPLIIFALNFQLTAAESTFSSCVAAITSLKAQLVSSETELSYREGLYERHSQGRAQKYNDVTEDFGVYVTNLINGRLKEQGLLSTLHSEIIALLSKESGGEIQKRSFEVFQQILADEAFYETTSYDYLSRFSSFIEGQRGGDVGLLLPDIIVLSYLMSKKYNSNIPVELALVAVASKYALEAPSKYFGPDNIPVPYSQDKWETE